MIKALHHQSQFLLSISSRPPLPPWLRSRPPTRSVLIPHFPLFHPSRLPPASFFRVSGRMTVPCAPHAPPSAPPVPVRPPFPSCRTRSLPLHMTLPWNGSAYPSTLMLSKTSSRSKATRCMPSRSGRSPPLLGTCNLLTLGVGSWSVIAPSPFLLCTRVIHPTKYVQLGATLSKD